MMSMVYLQIVPCLHSDELGFEGATDGVRGGGVYGW